MGLLLNRLKAVIISQKHANGLTKIEAQSENYLFKALLLEDKSLREVGASVYLLIKESEIALSTAKPSYISISNQIECKISNIRRGEILCEVILNFGEHRLSSMITTDSADRLALQVNDSVYALIKANEIYLENIDD